ncbi:DUF4190 domain-containing protein [Streptomyces sp. NBC_01244]|uniref:DUF4190 domain-containing protein n=1 Tax=Streptomyces sp. NBC_01244 TaxID=2903797 RepID=UPI002E10E7ED|nr:DUF4190 domain-containing protein [Streptomyces sp. NBC_01244]
MTDQSPESRDPWAPPEQPAVDLGKQRGGPGAPGVHDQQTVTGMPGAGGPQGGPQGGHPGGYTGGYPGAPLPGQTLPGQTPPAGTGPISAGAPAPQPGQTPAYGYPAEPDPAGYGYPTAQQPFQQQPGYQGHPGYAGYPGYPGGGYPGHPAYPSRSNGFGITALVLGILSVVTCYLGLLFGVPAIIFGVLGRGKAKRGEADNGGLALAGIITGAVGIVTSCVLIALVIFAVIYGDSGSDSDSDYFSPYENTQVLHRG